MNEYSITVRHNVEMGHRLSLQPDSKCFHLHGHSWLVELELFGELDDKGMVCGLNFGDIKKRWRGYLDDVFDHHMCLNRDDPLVGILSEMDTEMVDWGITTIAMDPTVENMAGTWGRQAMQMFTVDGYEVRVQEASTNLATWRYQPFG